MIYIDGFESNEVLPIYIGKSIDIQKRYKQHYTELLALNRLSYEEYKKYFFLKTYFVAKKTIATDNHCLIPLKVA